MSGGASILAGALRNLGPGNLVVVTGAGVSAASGLPTFRGRDPRAIWSRDVLEIGTREAFERDPVAWWRWFLSRFEGIGAARPNPAHLALAALERWHRARGGAFLLVSQNVDTLHEAAGSRHLVKVHGSADRVRCSRQGCRAGAPSGSLPGSDFDLDLLLRDPRPDNLPRCPSCGSLIRAHALLFDELYDEHEDYGFARVTQAFSEMELLVFAGTSFAVGITDLALRSAFRRGVPALSIDPDAAPPPGVRAIAGAAEEVLPAVAALLGFPARC